MQDYSIKQVPIVSYWHVFQLYHTRSHTPIRPLSNTHSLTHTHTHKRIHTNTHTHTHAHSQAAHTRTHTNVHKYNQPTSFPWHLASFSSLCLFLTDRFFICSHRECMIKSATQTGKGNGNIPLEMDSFSTSVTLFLEDSQGWASINSEQNTLWNRCTHTNKE